MQCFGPISVMKKGQSNPGVRDLVPCGRCAACLSNRRSEWVTRLEQEMRVSATAHFVTLTYQDPPVGDGGLFSLSKSDVQLFLKRLRKRLKKSNVRYYLVGEYGEKTVRPHYHAIFFNLPAEPLELLLKSWNNGLVHVGKVTSASIKYTLKYILLTKKDSNFFDYVEKPFSLMSKGLGKSYIDSRGSWHRSDVSRNYVVKSDGVRCRLPRYFRDKIFDKQQKERQRLAYEEERNKFESRSRTDFKDEHEQKADFARRTEKGLKGSSKF